VVYYFFTDVLLDPELFTMYEKLKAFYANQLYIWGLLHQRLAVLKCSNLFEDDVSDSVQMSVDCKNEQNEQNVANVIDVVNSNQADHQEEPDTVTTSSTSGTGCGTLANGTVQCRGCLKPSLTCVICLLPIRGVSTCCQLCGHAGHTKHLKQWFISNVKCVVPGCECYCINS
jgi:hypothetical protein